MVGAWVRALVAEQQRRIWRTTFARNVSCREHTTPEALGFREAPDQAF